MESETLFSMNKEIFLYRHPPALPALLHDLMSNKDVKLTYSEVVRNEVKDFILNTCVPPVQNLFHEGGMLSPKGFIITDPEIIQYKTTHEYTYDHPILKQDGVVFYSKRAGLTSDANYMLIYKNLLKDERLFYKRHPQRIAFLYKTLYGKIASAKEVVDALKLMVKNEASNHHLKNTIFAPGIIVSSILMTTIDEHNRTLA